MASIKNIYVHLPAHSHYISHFKHRKHYLKSCRGIEISILLIKKIENRSSYSFDSYKYTLFVYNSFEYEISVLRFI